MLADRLVKAIIEKKSPIVVGLDPRYNNIPLEIREKHRHIKDPMERVSRCFKEFNFGIIDSICDVVPMVKPQVAFYEQYGIKGMEAYVETCKYAVSKGLFVIGDVKRGDIGSTSKAYSNAHLGMIEVDGEIITPDFNVDFATINPYLGDDCMKEFIDEIKLYDTGMFILVKTSNPTSGQLQDLKVNGEDKMLYEKTAELVNNWSQQIYGKLGYSPVGAVVGATYPEELDAMRKAMPRSLFLVPGYGAQGGGAKDVAGAFDERGLGAIINSSRGVIFAFEKCDLDYKEAARQAVLDMQQDINEVLEAEGKKYWK